MWPWLFTATGRRVIFATSALAALGAGFLALRAHYIAIGKGEAAAAALDAGAKQLAALESERAQARTQAVAAPQTSLLPDLRRKLSVDPESNAASLSLPELRAADAIVTDYPLVTAENRDLVASNQTLTARTTSLTGEITAVVSERDLSFNWGDSVFTQYRACYNSFPRNRSFFARLCHVVTFGLGCKQRQLSLLPPSSLARQRPAKSASPASPK